MDMMDQTEYLRRMTMLEQEYRGVIVDLRAMLQRLNEREEPLEVDTMETGEYLQTKLELLKALQYAYEWDSRILTSLHDPYGTKGDDLDLDVAKEGIEGEPL